MNRTAPSFRGIFLSAIIAFFLLAVDARGQNSPQIVSPPLSQAVLEGSTVVLTISVSGELPITYSWRRNFEWNYYYSETLYSTNCTVVLTNLTPADAGFFGIDVQNKYGYGPGTQVMVGVISAGMETNGFALTLYGLTNSVWKVECTTNTPANWFTLTNLSIPMITGSSPSLKFVDLEATNRHRFYRVTAKVD